jgi:hypothetical protein
MKHILVLLLITLAIAQDASQEQIELPPSADSSMSIASYIKVKHKKSESKKTK